MVFKKRLESPTCFMTPGESLPPLMEGPNVEAAQWCHHRRRDQVGGLVKEWIEKIEKTTSQLLSLGTGSTSTTATTTTGTATSSRRYRMKQLLAALGTSLGPFPVGKLPPTVCPKDSPIETSSAQYIVQQFIAATGGSKLHNSVHNTYTAGRFRMHLIDFESPATNTSHTIHSHSNSNLNLGVNTSTSSTTGLLLRSRSESSDSGCFVLWQMSPDKWFVELAISGIKVRAGCDSKLIWKQSPFSGSETFTGPVRPLRRSLNGLDPKTLASMFLNSRCIGEKRIGDEDCFVLKLAADPFTLNTAAYSAAPDHRDVVEEEIIRHVAFGYFSQRSGLLVRLEDSQLTRVTELPRGAVSYWEVTVETTLGDYRAVDGETPVVIAHSGCTAVSVFRFGEESMCHTRTRVEESWWIDDAACNVAGLTDECFIPPADTKVSSRVSQVGEMFGRSAEEEDEQGDRGLVLW